MAGVDEFNIDILDFNFIQQCQSEYNLSFHKYLMKVIHTKIMQTPMMNPNETIIPRSFLMKVLAEYHRVIPAECKKNYVKELELSGFIKTINRRKIKLLV